MPTPDCFQDIGELHAKVEALEKLVEKQNTRISTLEVDRIKITSIGGAVAFVLTGIGILFAEPIKSFGSRLLD